ncbi:MAG TPA: peptide ABC transporter substrate-binding protein [Dehalococcoidia bacterium]|nr:peptide ABC transporter substrate-binding protein [Dehalococcoidia bacterium]
MKGKNAALLAGIGGLVLLVVVFVVLLGGGGGGDSGDGGDKASANPTPGSGGGCDAPKGTDLRLLGPEPIDLDPALIRDAGSAQYAVEVFSGLVQLNADLKVVPDIAESWTISPDGKVYTFTLRKNALFHVDERAVTADDFKFSLDRAAKLGRTLSTTADAYLGDIVGVRDVILGKSESISGVKAINATTLEITIDAPKPYFLAKMTYPTAYVVERSQVTANPERWWYKPKGTGPYKVRTWEIGERIILEANEKYYGGAPKIKQILFNLAGGSSLTQFENCEIDVSGLGIDDLERVQSAGDPLHDQYVTGPELALSYIGFSVKTPPFDDPKVRQAFAISIDRDQLTRVVGKDASPVATSFMMPGLPGYNPNAKLPAFDPVRAKQLLQESKYGGASGLPKVRLTVAGGAGGATVGAGLEAIQQMWKQNLGVDVEINQVETAAFYDDLDRGRVQMWSLGWIMDYPDPEDLIDLLFYSKSRQNNSGYNNPQFDALIEKARSEANPEARLKLYQDAEQILIQDLPWMPLNFGQQHMVVNPHVKGYTVNKIIVPFLRNVTIEP